jgi:hypothetical protein
VSCLCAVYQVTAPFRKDVYQWYLASVLNFPAVYPRVTLGYFNSIWRSKFPNIKLRKYLRFSKCGTCEELRAIRFDQKQPAATRKNAQRQLLLHYADIKHERATAEARKQYAIQNPTEVLSIAMDGTDQLPNGLPQFAQPRSGDANANHRFRLKFTLLRVHNTQTTYAFSHAENILGDPNLTIETLQRSFKAVERDLGKLPPKLHIQVDNCSRENKNSIVLNWFATLQERGQ